MTLTRSASEIAELHTKLVQTDIPSLPTLPLDPSQQHVSNKRRSSFLTTLSRFAAGSNSINNSNNTPTKQPLSPTSPRPSIGQYPTPAASPAANDADDPFSTPTASPSHPAGAHNNAGTTAGALSTSLAAYLTTLSNHPNVRVSRPWRRFVRVRTDDLESIRVERSIKRVRSDVAMHHPQPTTQSLMAMAPMLVADSSSVPVSDVESTHTQDLEPNSRIYRHAVPSLEESIGTGDGGRQSSLAGSMHDLQEEEEDDDMQRMREDAKIAELIAAGQLAATPSDPPTRLPSLAKSPTVKVKPTISSPVAVDVSTPTPTPAPVPVQAPAPVSAPPTHIISPTPSGPTGAPTLPPVNFDLSDLLPTPSPSPPTPTPQSAIDAAVMEAAITPTTATAVVGHRIPRSASADPDKASRLSRAWAQEEQDKQILSKQKTLKGSPSPRPPKPKRTTLDDFEMMRVLGKGCAGKVLLVRHKASTSLYAMKAITKRHVLAHQELQHTLTEQAVLKRMAHDATDPFVVKLWWSFHDKENLFLVMDFHPGGDLATQLARWGRLGRDRARFYAAEIVEGVEGLHAAGVVYRDLKPENILIGADGHIVLTDFGLSKEFPRRSAGSLVTAKAVSPNWIRPGSREGSTRSASASSSASVPWVSGRDITTTFCGTAEYLAPEVIQGLPYSYEVDWWSFGTMLYEMLTGITPFWANNHSDMYVRVLQDELQFPEDRAMDQDTKSLIRGLLQRNPALRMSEPRLKRHPYFSMIDWSHVFYKRYIPPYIPPIDPSNASDTQNFDEAFLDMDPTLDNDEDEDADGEASRSRDGSPPPLRSTKTKKDRTARNEGESDADIEDEPEDAEGGLEEDQEVDVFDGYSFKGRHSVIIDDENQLDGVERSSESEEDEKVEEEIAEDIPDLAKEVSDESIPPKLAHAASTVSSNDASRPEPIEEEVEEIQDEGSELPEVQATPISLKPSLGHSAPSEIAEGEQAQAIQDDEPDKKSLTPVIETDSAVDVASPSPMTRPASVFVEDLSENGITTVPSGQEEIETPSPPVPSKDVPDTASAPAPPVSGSTVTPTPAFVPKTAMRQPTTNAADTGLAPPKPPKAVTIAPPPPRNPKQASVAGKSGATTSSSSRPPVGMSDDEDDDWDFVETPGGEDRNGTRGNSLFARGVVDRYRLAVFRKSSNSGGAGGLPSGQSSRQGQRVVSNASRSSATGDASPESSEKRRGRGRLGKGPKTFLRARSPPALSPVQATSTPAHAVSSSGIPTLGSLGLSSQSPRPQSTKSGNGYSSLSFSGKRSTSIATGSSGSAIGALAAGTVGTDTSSPSVTTASTNATSVLTTIPNAGPSLKSKDSSMSMSPSGISGSGSSSVDVDGELGLNTTSSGAIGTTYTSMSVSTNASGGLTHEALLSPMSRSFSSARQPDSGYLSSGDTSTGGGLFGIGKRNTSSLVPPMSPASGEDGKKKKMKKYKEGAEKVLSLFGSPRQDKEKERERINAEREKITQLFMQQKQNTESNSTTTQKPPHGVSSSSPLTPVPAQSLEEQIPTTQTQS